MNRSVYDLLGLPRDLPGWKLTAKVHQVNEELAEAYHGHENVPGLLRVAVDILRDADKRDRYDSLLEWAEDATVVDFGEQKERVREAAEQLHFELVDQPGGGVLVQNLGVPEPPPPPPPPSAAQQPVARPTLRPVPAQPEPDPHEIEQAAREREELNARYARHGIVNGEFPPLALGLRVYSISFSSEYTLASAVRLRDSVHYNWVRQREDGSRHEYAFASWLGCAYTVDWAIGQPHRFMQLIDTRTRDSWDVAFCAPQYGFPILNSESLWAQFPWWAQFQSGTNHQATKSAQWRYGEAYPTRHVAPDYYFTGRSGWDREISSIFMTYVEEVCFWTRAYRLDFKVDPAETRMHARDDADHVAQVFTELPKRFRKKVGLPVQVRRSD